MICPNCSHRISPVDPSMFDVTWLKYGDIEYSVEAGALRPFAMRRLAPLSPIENSLFKVLFDRRGNMVDRAELITFAWPHANPSDNAINRKMYELRRKLSGVSDKVEICNRYANGYLLRMRPEVDDPLSYRSEIDGPAISTGTPESLERRQRYQVGQH